MATLLTASRLRPPPADFYRNLTVAGAVFVAVLELTYLVASGPGFWRPTPDAFGQTAVGRDFLNTWMGGRSALGSGPAAWYDFWAYNRYLKEFIGAPELHDYVWSYPPHILLFIWPIGVLPYLPAFLAWIVGGLALFLFVSRSGGVEKHNLLFIAVAPAVALNVFFGQNGFLTASLLIGGLISLDRRPLLAGVLLPVMLVLTGRWRTILSAGVTTVALVCATAMLYGRDVWTGYFEQVVPMQQYLQEHGEGMLFLVISSVFYGARLVGLPLGAAWGVQALVSAAALAAVVWTFWRRRDPVLSVALLVVAAFLFTPYALNYDMVVFGWVIALLRQRADNEPLDHYLLVALWALPAAMMITGLVNIPLAAFVLPAFAVRLLWRLAHAKDTVSAREPAITDSQSAPLHA
jgi:alpha-1,2-mannosyltransferase